MGTPQRVSRSAWVSPLIIVVALAMAGCWDSTENKKQELAACKLKAMQQWPGEIASKEHDEDRAYYVQICMEAAGYQLRPIAGCDEEASRWILDMCYSRGGR